MEKLKAISFGCVLRSCVQDVLRVVEGIGMLGMSGKMMLADCYFGGFFAIACFRAQAAGTPGQKSDV